MSDYSAIEVHVPAPWRLVGQLFALGTLFYVPLYVWFLFFSAPPDTNLLIIGWGHIMVTPIVICYLLPVFIGRYPRWFVRLVGRDYLLKFIADFKRRFNENRAEKAHILLPYAWFRDQKVYWLVLVGVCFILGIFHGID
jgi:hypothetical protein